MNPFFLGTSRPPTVYTSSDIGGLVRQARKGLGVTQRDLALTAGTGTRFVVDLEHGKETCELGKVLRVLRTLGIRMTMTLPTAVPSDGAAS